MPVRADLGSSIASAKAAGLRYVSGNEPGTRRARQGDGFCYHDARGRAVRHMPTLDRIRALAIPPAWTDVWICAQSVGHLQATGRDARGRKQYRYHPQWTAVRDSGKYDRMVEFGQALPAIRKRVAADLRQPSLSRSHVLATVVKLLEKTLIRIGNEEYVRANRSFGLTTLRYQHVRIKGNLVVFHFRAKSGIMQTIELNDRVLARNIGKCRHLPGHAVFQYLDGAGKPQCVGSSDVNAYVKDITGRPFTAKNFRTWAGSVMAARALCEAPPATSDSAFKRNVLKAVDAASVRLGNTRSVCRRCYVHPGVFDAYRAGVTIAGPRHGSRRMRAHEEEAAVLALLKRRWNHRVPKAA